MLNQYLDKAKTFFSENKPTIIKVGSAVVGAIIGAVVVGIVTSQREEFLNGEDLIDLENDEEREDEELDDEE